MVGSMFTVAFGDNAALRSRGTVTADGCALHCHVPPPFRGNFVLERPNSSARKSHLAEATDDYES